MVLCDENIEPVDFDTDADIVGLTGYVVHTQRIFEIAAEFRRRGKFVVDDSFIGNKKEAKELLRALADWQKANDYPIAFMTEVTLNIAQDDELLELMRQANFTTIFIGIESARAASLQETHKTQNLRDRCKRLQQLARELQKDLLKSTKPAKKASALCLVLGVLVQLLYFPRRARSTPSL